MPVIDARKAKILQELYYDPRRGLTNAAKLYDKVRDKGIKMDEVRRWLASQELSQQYRRPATKQFYPITGPPNSYQADLIFYPQTKVVNNGYDVIMTVIEITTRKAYCLPMKGKATSEVLRVTREWLRDVKVVENLTTDKGSEWISAPFKELMKQHNVSHYTADEGDHTIMGMIERFNRTIKALVSKYRSAYKTKKWVDALPDLVENYNDNVHSTTGYRPNDVGEKEAREIRQRARDKTYALDQKKNLNIGDKVRVRLRKDGAFTKEGKKWSDTVYEIVEDHVKSFKVGGLNRRYKHYELQKVSVPAQENPYERKTKSFDVEKHLAAVRGGRGKNVAGKVEMPRTRKKTGVQVKKPGRYEEEDPDEYEVEKVLDEKEERGKKWFLVKWVGYRKPTWEPEENLR